jgi:hypothetical protein
MENYKYKMGVKLLIGPRGLIQVFAFENHVSMNEYDMV